MFAVQLMLAVGGTIGGTGVEPSQVAYEAYMCAHVVAPTDGETAKFTGCSKHKVAFTCTANCTARRDDVTHGTASVAKV